MRANGQAAPAAAAAGDRAAIDEVYALIARRAFEEARARWDPVAARLQKGVEAALARTADPAADPALRRRFGELLFVQGLLDARLGKRADALALLRKADGYGFPPLDSPLMALAADCLLELDEAALAAQAYRELLKASPGNVQARLRLGIALFSSGQFEPAARELEETLRRDPACPQAHFYLGAVLFEQKRAEPAKAHLKQELQGDPRCFACMAKLAHLEYLAGDDAACEAWLTKAAALDREYVETDLVYGLLYNRAGKAQLAVQHLQRVVARAPGFATARYQLALAYQRAGDTDKAREQREIYDRLLREQKARSLGVRGSGEQP